METNHWYYFRISCTEPGMVIMILHIIIIIIHVYYHYGFESITVILQILSIYQIVFGDEKTLSGGK